MNRRWFTRQRALVRALDEHATQLRYWKQVANAALEQKRELRTALDQAVSDGARWARRCGEEADRRRAAEAQLHEQELLLAALGQEHIDQGEPPTTERSTP